VKAATAGREATVDGTAAAVVTIVVRAVTAGIGTIADPEAKGAATAIVAPAASAAKAKALRPSSRPRS
jgi:hypothetical protein